MVNVDETIEDKVNNNKKLLVDYKKHQRMVSINSEVMTEFELARWMCLIQAVNTIEQKAVKLKVDLDKINWCNPIELQYYIDDFTPSMLTEIEHFEALKA